MKSAYASPLWVCWLVFAMFGMRGAAADEEAKPDPRDVKRVEEFLSANVQGKWQTGPTRLENKSVTVAYPDSRFYFVFSGMYPIARADQISAMLRLDKEGKVTQLKTPGDYNTGLMKIAKEDDAKTAAAAIMSLTFGPFGPVPVAADDVQVGHEGKGWVCTAGQPKGNKYRVVFDQDGKCTEAEHGYGGPLPICIGGMFQPVSLTRDNPGLGHDLGGALEVASVESDSIAARAGLSPGDIIVSFANRPLPAGDVIQAMRQIVYPLKQQGGVTRPIKVLRGRQLLEMTLAW